MQITTIGLDIAKRVFQAHGVDAAGQRGAAAQAAARARCWSSSRRCRRAWWASRPAARRITGRARSAALGHEVRLIPPPT